MVDAHPQKTKPTVNLGVGGNVHLGERCLVSKSHPQSSLTFYQGCSELIGSGQNGPFPSCLAPASDHLLVDVSCGGRRALKQPRGGPPSRNREACCQPPLSVCILLLILDSGCLLSQDLTGGWKAVPLRINCALHQRVEPPFTHKPNSSESREAMATDF